MRAQQTQTDRLGAGGDPFHVPSDATRMADLKIYAGKVAPPYEASRKR